MSDKIATGQTPSKVLHIRNLPHETTMEELEDLAKPFGKLVKTKLNVGANRNQAFIEFPDVQAAVNMVHHFITSAEPAKVRGKTVYLQYSTRQEIVNATSSAEQPSNVLLATLENLQPDTIITIEQLWAVFAAFGMVEKIATFEKAQGFQALVQYQSADLARAAKDALDGRTIPRSIMQSRTPCQLRIAFSGHRDLNVRYQSHRGRDFTNPDLPWAEMDPDAASKGIQAPLSHSPEYGNVLLVQIENYMYELTVDSIHEIFQRYGEVRKVAIFERNKQWYALVQYPDAQAAAAAKQVLEGHAMYEGGANVLRLSYSVHSDLNVRNSGDKSRDFGGGAGMPPGGAYPPPHGHGPPMDYGVPGHAGYGGPPPSAGPPMGGQYGDEAPVTGRDYVNAHRAAVATATAAYKGGAYGTPAHGAPVPRGPPSGYGPPMGMPPPPGAYGAPPRGPPMYAGHPGMPHGHGPLPGPPGARPV